MVLIGAGSGHDASRPRRIPIQASLDSAFDFHYLSLHKWCGYNEITRILHTNWNCGFFSNLTVTLYILIYLHNQGYYTEKIDFTNAFSHYKRNDQKTLDIYPHLFTQRDLSLEKRKRMPFHWHQDYSKLDFEDYSDVIEKYFTPSNKIFDIQKVLIDKYQLKPEKTIVSYYRGTDKSTDIPLADKNSFLEVTKELAKNNPDHRILVQSDEKQYFDLLVNYFGSRCFFIEELPASETNQPTFYDENIDKFQNGQYLLAVFHLISQCNSIVTGTGNVSFWHSLYRKHMNNVYQFDENGILTSGHL